MGTLALCYLASYLLTWFRFSEHLELQPVQKSHGGCSEGGTD